MITLEIVAPDGRRWEQRIDRDSIIIGRSGTADLTIADRALSRQHARISRSGEDWYVEDLDSRNGTYLPSGPVRSLTKLEIGDRLSIGSSFIRIVEPAASVEDDDGIDLDSGNTVFRSVDELISSGAVPAPSGKAPPTEIDDEAVARLHILNQVHQALGHSVELDDLLELILEKVFDHLKPEEAAIFLRDGDGYRRAAARSSGGNPDGLWSRSLFREVVDGRKAALVLDARSDERFSNAQSLMLSGLRTILAAPLLDDEQALGMIVLGSTRGFRAYEESDMELLVSLAAVAAMRIANVRLAEEAAERRRMEQELALGRRIQVALIPEKLPEIEGWDLHAENDPCRGVSGDIYNLVQREDGRLVVMIADVSGKGIAAALLTASLEALAAGPLDAGMPLDETCARVSRLLYLRTPSEKYATAFFAEIDTDSGLVRFVNAGHNPGLVLRLSGQAEWLEASGVPLGLFQKAEYSTGEFFLNPRDTLLLYTDGLTEAADSENREYGDDRLRSMALDHRLLPLQQFSRQIAADVDEFVGDMPYADDRTLVLIRRRAGVQA